MNPILNHNFHRFPLGHIQGIKGRPISTGLVTCAGATVLAYVSNMTSCTDWHS